MKHKTSIVSILTIILAVVTFLAEGARAHATLSPMEQMKAVNGSSIPFAAMDAFLAAQMDACHLPGLSIAFINHGKIVYQKALGYADVEAHKKVDVATVFEAASMSKPVFAFFVLKLVERGVLTLDTPLFPTPICNRGGDLNDQLEPYFMEGTIAK